MSGWNMVKVITYAPLAVYALTCFTFVWRSSFRVRAKAIWMMTLLACFSKFVFFEVLGGHPFVPMLPEKLIWLWDWAYSGAMILFALSLPFFFRFRGKSVLLPLVAWSLSAWGLWNGLCLPVVVETELEFEDLPASLDGYRIVQLADIHASSAARRWRTQAIVDLVNAQQADLVCLTGDNVDGRIAQSRAFVEPLMELKAKDGVYACTGNHEYYFRYPEWKAGFYDQAKNIRFLTNACAFPRPGLALAGVPDPIGLQKRSDVAPDVRLAFAAATNGEFRVLLQHQPKWAQANIREVGVDLQLSGHTHGGIAPGLSILVSHHNAGYDRGFYRYGRSILHVSPGCGQWAGFPMRFFNPSEITVIRLRRK